MVRKILPKKVIVFIISSTSFFFGGIMFSINLAVSIVLFILGTYFGYINVIKIPIITWGDKPPSNPSEGDIWLQTKN